MHPLHPNQRQKTTLSRGTDQPRDRPLFPDQLQVFLIWRWSPTLLPHPLPGPGAPVCSVRQALSTGQGAERSVSVLPGCLPQDLSSVGCAFHWTKKNALVSSWSICILFTLHLYVSGCHLGCRCEHVSPQARLNEAVDRNASAGATAATCVTVCS